MKSPYPDIASEQGSTVQPEYLDLRQVSRR